MDYQELQKRRKIIDISPDFVLNTLRGFNNYQYYRMPRIEGLPENAILHDIFYDGLRRSFGVIVLCEDWPVVKDGCMAPSLSAYLYEDVYKVRHHGNDILLKRVD